MVSPGLFGRETGSESRRGKAVAKGKESKKIVFDTFVHPTERSLSDFRQKDPSCFNGIVRVQKYRITVEPIDEDIEVVHSRLIELWLMCNNSHRAHDLSLYAEKIGLDLHSFGRFGSKNCRSDT